MLRVQIDAENKSIPRARLTGKYSWNRRCLLSAKADAACIPPETRILTLQTRYAQSLRLQHSNCEPFLEPLSGRRILVREIRTLVVVEQTKARVLSREARMDRASNIGDQHRDIKRRPRPNLSSLRMLLQESGKSSENEIKTYLGREREIL